MDALNRYLDEREKAIALEIRDWIETKNRISISSTLRNGFCGSGFSSTSRATYSLILLGVRAWLRRGPLRGEVVKCNGHWIRLDSNRTAMNDQTRSGFVAARRKDTVAPLGPDDRGNCPGHRANARRRNAAIAGSARGAKRKAASATMGRFPMGPAHIDPALSASAVAPACARFARVADRRPYRWRRVDSFRRRLETIDGPIRAIR